MSRRAVPSLIGLASAFGYSLGSLLSRDSTLATCKESLKTNKTSVLLVSVYCHMRTVLPCRYST